MPGTKRPVARPRKEMRREPARRTDSNGNNCCVQCGKPIPATLTARARYCGPDCKRTAHTQARHRERALARIITAGSSGRQIVLTPKQSQQIRQALANTALLLTQHQLTRNAIDIDDPNVSAEAALFVRFFDQSERLVRAAVTVIDGR